nr:unnamed protein product [Callosobruchus chinensis]
MGKLPCRARPARDPIRLLGGLRLPLAEGLHQKRQDQSYETRDSQQKIT